MAKHVIYPYGEGGSLPSGYPIVDDLETDAADKALSAGMGKVLKDNLTIVQANVQLLLDALANLAFTNVPKPTLTPIEWNAIPSVSVSPSSLSFSAIVGGTETATFTVNGSNLNGSLSIGISGSNGSLFSVDKSTITANEAASGATIAVTYHPSARGTHSATITISGGGASAKTISLNGTAINQDVATYNVTHNLTHLNMVPDGGTVESGGTFSGRLTVTDSSLYDLPTSIQVSGVHGTVSYNSDSGEFSIPNITSNIKITASAADKPVATPTLTVTPSTININGTVGEQTSATFFVQGTNLTGEVSIAFVAPDGTVGWLYTQRIPIANATRGYTCTLYWTPESEVTNAIGKITISSAGATSKEITVNASATAQDQPSLLSVVRGWALTEDYTIKADVYQGSGSNTQWTYPRKPFVDNIHNAAHCLNGHGKSINSDNGLLYYDSTHGLPQDTSGTTSNIYLCYTDYIRIPVNSSATGIYYGHGFARRWLNNDSKQFNPSIVFYKKDGGVMTPILVKSIKDNANFRLLESSDLGDVLTLIKNGTYELYCRASFVTSDANTINTACCLRFNSASGATIWSAADATTYPYQLVNEPIDNGGDTHAQYASSDGTMTNATVYDILKAGKTVAS